MTPAGRSRFGKLIRQYDGRLFDVEGRIVRLEVKGAGKYRSFIVIAETPAS
jgi:hypothetical protein